MGKHPRLKEWEEKELQKSVSRFPERKAQFINHGGDVVPRISLPYAPVCRVFYCRGVQ